MNTSDLIAERSSSPFNAARAEHARGRRVVGYIGDDIPVELILAADALPLRLSGIPQATPLADRYLESSFGPSARSLLQTWLSGDLDFLDAIVFPRSNDTAQRLYYYVCELQRRAIHQGPRSLIYDLARVNRDTSREHTIAATRSLASQLESSAARLDAAVARITDRAALLRKLAHLRAADAALAGSDALRLWRVLQQDWTKAFEKDARDWIESSARIANQPRLLLAGSTPPDERFHSSVESAGANIVDEFFDEAPVHASIRWAAGGKSLDDIADAYRSARSTAMTLLHNPDILVQRARSVGAAGVVLWFIEQDEGIVWEVPRQIERLRQAGIETLVLTRQPWAADADCLARVQAFAASLRASQ